MRHFQTLRITDWKPEFIWVESIEEAVDLINKPHEDYPHRVNSTLEIVKTLTNNEVISTGADIALFSLAYRLSRIPTGTWPFNKVPLQIENLWLCAIQNYIFADESHAGRWRECNVVVGLHRPVDYLLVEKYMKELRDSHHIKTIDDLKDWYWDFETIHPFFDGNGRTGGVILAVISHALEPDMGWLAPLQ